MVVVELVAAGGAGAGAQAAIRTVAAASIGTGRNDMAGAYAGTPPAREFRAALVVPGYERLFGVPALRVARRRAKGASLRTYWPGPLGHLAMQPRSIGMLVPVMCLEASEARKSTSSATSSGSSHGDGSAW